MTNPQMSENDSHVAGTSAGPSRAALAAAVVCVGVAGLLAATTVFITFGLAQSYGFGPVWDASAFTMTVAAAALTGTALVGAVRLARVRLRALAVLGTSVAGVLAAGYVAGVLGNSLHH